ncbi:unnamed protein product [Caretta caretta]
MGRHCGLGSEVLCLLEYEARLEFVPELFSEGSRDGKLEREGERVPASSGHQPVTPKMVSYGWVGLP